MPMTQTRTVLSSNWHHRSPTATRKQKNPFAVSLNLHGLSYTRRQSHAQRLSIATFKGHDDSATAAAPVFLSPFHCWRERRVDAIG